MIGDCDRCGHSAMYHLPFVGCTKCTCGEFRAWLAVTVLIATLLCSCTDESASRRALEGQGFRDISFTGYSFFECGRDDTFHTGFAATNAVGRRVEGTVCCGFLFKGCTVRF